MMRPRAAAVGLVLVAGFAAWAGSALAARTPYATVRLVRPNTVLYPGEQVPVPVVNEGPSPIFRPDCFVLERWTGRGWREITRTHGADVHCDIGGSPVQPPRSRSPAYLWLWDDLRPGSYRITLYYRAVPPHWRVLRALNRHDPSLRMLITVGPAPKRRHPHLSEKRLLAIAESSAVRGGDPHPTLIQHAAGPHLEAEMVASGDLVFEWNWSYLIAIRGHFKFTGISVPPGVPSAITGSVITLVLDAASGQVTDFGLSNSYPHLARLGKVTTDLRR